MRSVSIFVAALAFGLAGCASVDRPPVGVSQSGGTDFGYWNRDGEGSVDQSFRTFISSRYKMADLKQAEADLTKDGFTCKDKNRPDATAIPDLECTRLFEYEDDIHTWSVEFWPNDRIPRAQYSRTRMRNSLSSGKTYKNNNRQRPTGGGDNARAQ